MVADFVQRVAAYPAVASAWQRAASYYDWALAASPGSVRAAAGFTEDGLRRAAATAGPLLARFEPGLSRLDRLACAQLLDRLEARCPAVREATAEDLIASARGAVRPTMEAAAALMAPVNNAVAKAQSAKAYSLERCRRLSADSGDLVVTWVDRCVDHYLPEAQAARASAPADDDEEAFSAPQEGVGRKLRRRLLSRVNDLATRLDDGNDDVAAQDRRQQRANDDAAAAVRLAALAAAAAARRRAREASLAGVEFAAARLPDLESLPIAGRMVGWLSAYKPEQFLFDPFDLENRLLALAESESAESFESNRLNAGCSKAE